MSTDLLRRAAALMRERAQAATEGPWFLQDCEGELEVWREGAIRVYKRDENGTISVWDTPGTYLSTDLILEHSLDTWDKGGDADDDQRRADAEHIASWHPAVALAVADWLDAEATQSVWDGTTYVVSRSAEAVARAYLGETS